MLYQTIATHWPEFKSRMGEQGELPKFVVRQFEQYLDCGLLAPIHCQRQPSRTTNAETDHVARRRLYDRQWIA